MGNQAVVGTVRDRDHAETVRAALEAAGVRVGDISMLFATREGAVGDGPARWKGGPAAAGLDGRAGATVGAVLGLVAGGCAVAITGLGPLVLGPLIATVGSAAIGAAAGALVGMRLPERSRALGDGGVTAPDLVLSVYAESPSQVLAVKQILEAHAASGVLARTTNLG